MWYDSTTTELLPPRHGIRSSQLRLNFMITWNVQEVTAFFGIAPERPYGEDTQAVFAFDSGGNRATLTVQPYNEHVILTIARAEEPFAELRMDCESIEIQSASDPEQQDSLLLSTRTIGGTQHWIRVTSLGSMFVIESNVGFDESEEIIPRPRSRKHKSQIGCVGVILILLILLLIATVVLPLIVS